jgi:hypothetical protein
MSVKIISFAKKSPVWLFIIGSVLLLTSVVLWWTLLYNRPDPDKLFWSMLERSLTTESVTIESEQEQQDMSVKQTARYQLGATNLAHSATVIKQAGTLVKSEMVATPKADYTRYTQIDSDSKGADGKPLNFSKLLNTWAQGQEGSGELFSQALFDNVVLHANLSQPQREKLLTQMRNDNIYEIDGKPTRRVNKETGRTEYVYKVKVQYIPYIHLLKNFAHEVGLKNFEQIDPNSYTGTPPFETVLIVDVRSRHLVGVEQSDGQQSQKYSGHGIPVRIEVPKQAITEDELKARFAELQ